MIIIIITIITMITKMIIIKAIIIVIMITVTKTSNLIKQGARINQIHSCGYCCPLSSFRLSPAFLRMVIKNLKGIDFNKICRISFSFVRMVIESKKK